MSFKSVPIIGVYSSIAELEDILSTLKAEGIRHSDVSCLIPQTLFVAAKLTQNTKLNNDSIQDRSEIERTCNSLQWTDRVGEILLSDLGLFIGSGPIKAASLHTAHSKDGIVETLARMGVAKPLAEQCKKALTNGKILLSVHAHDEQTERKASSIIKTASAA